MLKIKAINVASRERMRGHAANVSPFRESVRVVLVDDEGEDPPLKL
jgi:hypothetical protein